MTLFTGQTSELSTFTGLHLLLLQEFYGISFNEFAIFIEQDFLL